MTSNGISLKRKLPALVAAGLTHLNISLDTLDSQKYELITRRRGYEAVMEALHTATRHDAAMKATKAEKAEAELLAERRDRIEASILLPAYRPNLRPVAPRWDGPRAGRHSAALVAAPSARAAGRTAGTGA